MTETTFNPNNSYEDGNVGRGIGDQTYAQIHDGVGNARNDTAGTTHFNASQDSNVSETWDSMYRGIFMFNTSTLGATAIISGATFGLVATNKINDFTGGDYVAIVSVDSARINGIDSDDYADFGTTIFAPNIAVSSITADSSTFTEWTLNSDGLDAINKTGATKIGVRVGADLSNDAATFDAQWVNGAQNMTYVTVATSEEVLSGDKAPRLVVTYTVPTFTPRAIMF